ncbi:MAG: hypothetical protein RRZ64_04615 [Rikenellaceae bacterium]
MILSELILLTATREPEYVIDLITHSIEEGENIEVDSAILEAILKIKSCNGDS